jgi:uncharacterized radical SAM superfamily Fe-S cluster-containing enzyme
VTEACDLACPVCFADAADRNGRHRPLAEIETMLDVLVESEGEPDLVQISGGEPTLHPEFFAILDEVKRRPIRHVMINTNGVRLAQDPAFVARLATYRPALEIYLQFDSLRDEALMDLRGARLSASGKKPWKLSNRPGFRPLWSSRSSMGSTTTRSARSSATHSNGLACAG